MLTDPVDTALFQTPTMSFGEVGTTTEQSTSGYASSAHGVGHFENTRVLERMVRLTELTWSTTSSGFLYSTDINQKLEQIVRNQNILSQFEFMRSGIEVTIRLNTNQFYYGALGVVLFPFGGLSTGARVDELMVLDPSIISASSAESVVKTYKYCYPNAWMEVNNVDASEYPVILHIEVLAPLTSVSSNMPDSINVQVWARFIDVELSYPTNDSLTFLKRRRFRAESKSFPSVRFPKKGKGNHPAMDSDSGVNSIDGVIRAVESVTIGDAISEVKSLASFVTENWGSVVGALGMIFDKPDQSDYQMPVIVEGSKDLFVSDIADTNVSVSLYKTRYVDPSSGRMPMTKSWTVSDYSRIPGLRQPYMTYAAQGDANSIFLIQSHPDNTTYKIPLDYAYLASRQWRGSVKVCLQFFTSAFISARFVVQYINGGEFPSSFPTEYDSGLSKVINVKGDTVDTITLPWLSSWWWTSHPDPQIKITCSSAIASTDTVTSPLIYLLLWVAGGDDIQFAFPRVVRYTEWNNAPPPTKLVKEREKGDLRKSTVGVRKFRAEAAMGSIFQKTFPPMGENAHYDIDRGFATAEMMGAITDVAKRYSNLSFYNGGDYSTTPGFPFTDLDAQFMGNVNSQLYADWYAFRTTFFGQWRACFLCRSGGYRWRYYDQPTNRTSWALYDTKSAEFVNGTVYNSPYDGVSRLTVPQVSNFPFGVLGSYNQPYQPEGLSIVQFGGSAEHDETHLQYVAARDDLQFGYPILPTGLSLPVSGS